jgi:hypothetical protein
VNASRAIRGLVARRCYLVFQRFEFFRTDRAVCCLPLIHQLVKGLEPQPVGGRVGKPARQRKPFGFGVGSDVGQQRVIDAEYFLATMRSEFTT